MWKCFIGSFWNIQTNKKTSNIKPQTFVWEAAGSKPYFCFCLRKQSWNFSHINCNKRCSSLIYRKRLAMSQWFTFPFRYLPPYFSACMILYYIHMYIILYILAKGASINSWRRGLLNLVIFNKEQYTKL